MDYQNGQVTGVVLWIIRMEGYRCSYGLSEWTGCRCSVRDCQNGQVTGVVLWIIRMDRLQV